MKERKIELIDKRGETESKREKTGESCKQGTKQDSMVPWWRERWAEEYDAPTAYNKYCNGNDEYNTYYYTDEGYGTFSREGKCAHANINSYNIGNCGYTEEYDTSEVSDTSEVLDTSEVSMMVCTD